MTRCDYCGEPAPYIAVRGPRAGLNLCGHCLEAPHLGIGAATEMPPVQTHMISYDTWRAVRRWLGWVAIALVPVVLLVLLYADTLFGASTPRQAVQQRVERYAAQAYAWHHTQASAACVKNRRGQTWTCYGALRIWPPGGDVSLPPAQTKRWTYDVWWSGGAWRCQQYAWSSSRRCDS